MNIGQASKASGVSSKMIRYYEQIGLIRPALRTASSYRTYGDNDIHTLRFVRRARDLGFSVEQIKELLALWRDRSRASSDVKSVALEHVAELERKIAAIQVMTRTLKHLASHCHGDDRPECPIIDEIASGVGKESTDAVKTRFGIVSLK
ncbi:Cu(I)-responsive transcriptional regulator [Sinorhizobium fredii]|uniref:Cu(I)-responsive transcriptional regulator n=1 Tax=Rhizobium fredii TaxID=380 RepID=UPI00129536C9|nr:Cu(I)-responsive transcriptional regulator [Sinorhizobium fredii]MQW94314.1 Cu(I)-responsive transcriptional regulator [Sinorhizobium fredii]UTY46118.1 Cu(I)-responsive transcriptional regulator [Sinorhizobium fredii]